jgi:hypothetical protein
MPTLIEKLAQSTREWSTAGFPHGDYAATRRDRRLLLTNYDIGIAVPAHAIQLGLNFAEKTRELFAGREMGEDALRLLNDIIPLQAAIHADVAAELPHLRETLKWAASTSIKAFGKTTHS